jgi:hypothetical protein
MSRRNYFSDFTDPPAHVPFWEEDTLDAEDDDSLDVEESTPETDESRDLRDLVDDMLNLEEED